LLRVHVDEEWVNETKIAVDDLMGTRPDARFRFIQDRAAFVEELDI
jgi:topoisomerase-4 subunit B